MRTFVSYGYFTSLIFRFSCAQDACLITERREKFSEKETVHIHSYIHTFIECGGNDFFDSFYVSFFNFSVLFYCVRWNHFPPLFSSFSLKHDVRGRLKETSWTSHKNVPIDHFSARKNFDPRGIRHVIQVTFYDQVTRKLSTLITPLFWCSHVVLKITIFICLMYDFGHVILVDRAI